MTDIRLIWKNLQKKNNQVTGMIIEPLRYGGLLSCYLGFVPVTNIKVFQLCIEKELPIKRSWLQKFRGVEIQILPFVNESYYTIMLLDNDLEDVFYAFIDDILEKLTSISDSRNALILINQRVNYWRKLFARVTGEVLSAERQRGLYGELFFLRLCLQNSSNQQETVLSWRGSDGAHQDFCRNQNAVEIKTTKANSSSVHISNEQQLDFTAWDYLILGVISVTETTGSQNSLAGIIEEIKDLVNYDSEIIPEFETRLEQAGINNDMIENYDEISYSVNNRRFFHIQEGFPVIIRENLQNDAIHSVKYQIDISSCNSFEISEEHALNAII